MDKNWKTTLAGVLPGVTVFLYDFIRGLQAGQEFDVKTMVLGLALAVLGYFAKSKDVTGGTVAATPEAVVRVEKQEAATAVAVAVEAKKEAADAVAKTIHQVK